MPTSFTSVDRPYDFVLWEVEQRFCRVAATIRNAAGVTIAAGGIVPGQPLNLEAGPQWETADGTAEAGVDGFFIDHRKTEQLLNTAITAKKYQILVRGPALVNKDAIPAADPAGVAFVLADLVTRMAALSIQVLQEADTVEQQTT